jgi:ketosteroid isomerase-like protein
MPSVAGQHPRLMCLCAFFLAGLALTAAAAKVAAADESTAAAAKAAGAEEPSAAAKSAITERLVRWTSDFNEKNLEGVCGLFAPDLSYTIDDIQNGSRDQLCANIREALAKPGLRLHYDEPAINDILLSGDLAVVRLTWTLTAEKNGVRDTTTEQGMDVFRRAADGVWSIARYIAFSTRPNAVLKASVPLP